ncbi:unnamed protein product, partial [Candidula unifasciata]
LMFEAKAYCGRNYYGHNCSVACMARNDSRGHYSCHPTNGSKICFAGWIGENCIVKRNQCSGVTCRNGGTCQNLINMFSCDAQPASRAAFVRLRSMNVWTLPSANTASVSTHLVHSSALVFK